MQPIASDVAWSVCLWVITMSCPKTAELLSVPFVMWTRLGPRDHVLGEGLDPPGEGSIQFWGHLLASCEM